VPLVLETDHRGLEQNRSRLFKHALERLQEARALRSINDPVITAHRDSHARAHGDLPVDDDWRILDSTNRQDPSLRWIDDCREPMDPKHAEVRQ